MVKETIDIAFLGKEVLLFIGKLAILFFVFKRRCYLTVCKCLKWFYKSERWFKDEFYPVFIKMNTGRYFVFANFLKLT